MQADVQLVKNMVCHRCVLAVQDILQAQHIPYTKVTVGEIHLPEALKDRQRKALENGLQHIGLELIDNRMGGLIEKVKQLIILKARNEVSVAERRQNLSQYLAAGLHHEYTYISSLFSSVEGRTIENLYIEQRIEKAKELLVYNQSTLAEIAEALDYSSVAHLSAQFKKVTGLTPSHFRTIGYDKRRSLDSL
jgi:AraC family transcriptional regulator